MSFFFEGNGFFSDSYITNSTTTNNIITTSKISTSSIDMLDTAGNYQNITNVAIPINPHDAVIKQYVDDLNIRLKNYDLTGTTGTLLTNDLSGSYVVTVTNLVMNGPSATFHITKNSPSVCGHIVRHTLSPGLGSLTSLNITWPTYSGPYLIKSNGSYDGSYRVKII
jgi:ABC-type antimicrobial peptide transport system permease subunit